MDAEELKSTVIGEIDARYWQLGELSQKIDSFGSDLEALNILN